MPNVRFSYTEDFRQLFNQLNRKAMEDAAEIAKLRASVTAAAAQAAAATQAASTMVTGREAPTAGAPGTAGGQAGPGSGQGSQPAINVAPADASYLVLGLHSGLSAERVLTAGTNMAFVDTGANGTLTLNASAGAGVSSLDGMLLMGG